MFDSSILLVKHIAVVKEFKFDAHRASSLLNLPRSAMNLWIIFLQFEYWVGKSFAKKFSSCYMGLTNCK